MSTPITLRWIASVATSALHVADVVADGRPILDSRLAELLPPPCRELRARLEQSSFPVTPLWRLLLAFAHQFDDPEQLAAMAIRKSVGWRDGYEAEAHAIKLRILAVVTALRTAVPGVLDELAARTRPLRELWEARGPGLLAAVGRLTDPRLIAESADVVLVLPVSGGGGDAHLANNSVRLEAVLTNQQPELAEVLRLGWLLAQLQCEIPCFAECVAPERQPEVARLAMLPVVLEAASQVELATCDEPTLSLAVTAWGLEPRDGSRSATETAELILTWWRTYQDSQPGWRTGLTALDAMLLAAPASASDQEP